MRQVHFTLGPVQGFVAQARRTRDLWAGSFLLSYLAGQAMHRALRLEGTIVFPRVHAADGTITDPLLRAIDRVQLQGRCSDGPFIGSLPNRFVAELPEGTDPAELAQAVRAGWARICRAVWEEYVAPVEHLGQGTAAIWQRQTEGFWEMAWAVGGDPTLLDQRKNWRCHVPSVEPGDKCSLMGDMQELSGHTRPAREAQREFWQVLARRVRPLELDPGERLCSISLVKRLFPLVAERAIGWAVPTSYPSTVYLAAVPWLARLCQGHPEAAAAYGALAEQLFGDMPKERADRFPILQAAIAAHPQTRTLIQQGGNLLFPETVSNPRLWPGADPARLKMLAEGLQSLTALAGAPSPYYALLLMDGDGMGALLKDHAPDTVSAGLAAFTARVPCLVAEANGVLVYAGGDDVLALLPLPDALRAAARLRTAYLETLGAALGGTEAKPTISASIVYAHHHAPLRQVVRWAHKLLDDGAKDETGRDALAVGVWQSGGPTLQWAVPWPVLVEGQPEGQTLLDELTAIWSGEEEGSRGYSGRFFYKIREQFELLTDPERRDLLPDLDPVQVLVAEYRRSREPGMAEVDQNEAHRRIELLLRVCRRYRRDQPGERHRPVGPLCADGPLLVRFLARKGGE